jgi:diaminohydroxyphosphoribosylaminopyrimidine deaminase/5-amino-6-(5-phosphoribosylamino)uracil reductase
VSASTTSSRSIRQRSSTRWSRSHEPEVIVSTGRDARFMRQALALAERGRGLTFPNPMVGAVVVNDADTVVGEGFHEGAGGPHAEIVALAAAGTQSHGATLYVTLEPCCHHGRTPPCAPAVSAAGIRRVVAAFIDPNPRVGGRGLSFLRAAGIEVTEGVLGDEAQRQNRAFVTAMRLARPHVTLKAAMTLDGRIADIHGESKWITGSPARARAHRLRSESDAILVGIETVLRDDPALTVRLERPWPREPYRVVLDTHARTPRDARLITAGTPTRTLVITGPAADAPRAAALTSAGVTVIPVALRDGRVDVRAALAALAARELRAVLVEGGGDVHGALLDAGVVDRVAVFIAPRLLGGRGATSVIAGEGNPLKSAARLTALEVTQLGDDLLIEADVERNDAPASQPHDT